jgi:hypothetical protein
MIELPLTGGCNCGAVRFEVGNEFWTPDRPREWGLRPGARHVGRGGERTNSYSGGDKAQAQMCADFQRRYSSRMQTAHGR